MPETAQDEWLQFLQQFPQYYELSKSMLFISLLEVLAKEAKSIDHIHNSFPGIESSDLEAMLNMLIKLNLVSEIRAGRFILYKATEAGQQLLGKYKKTRKFFEV